MIPEIFSLYPKSGSLGPEVISTVLSGRRFRLEHIISLGEASPDGFWYDQEENEWVALINGSAKLEFPEGSVDLKSGDCLLIPAHRKHRVSFTSPDAVWIALHFEEETPPEPRAAAGEGITDHVP